ncbi:MAG: NTP transferase domain-containing protein [Patulibacter sp.]|nr:NTP transferase domain-containing protein [Patulibacter sp.]
MPPVTVAAILAGGRSRRMGAAKAGVRLDGRPLLDHVADAARAAGLTPVAVAKRASVLPASDVERWDEPDEPQHPLTGVVAALRRAAAPIVVVPVDLPRVAPGLLAAIAAHPARLAVVEAADRLHPLLGRFDPADADALEDAARAGAPVVRTVLALGAVRIGDDEVARHGDPARLLRNVNRPEDLGAA